MNVSMRNVVDHLRNKYPEGSRVELVEMEHYDAPPIGTLGTVRAVDSYGTLDVNWDNGSNLPILFGVDRVRKVG